MPEFDIMQSPGTKEFRRRLVAALATYETTPMSTNDDSNPSPPIRQATLLAWLIGGCGFIFSTASVALVAVLWNNSITMTTVSTELKGLRGQFDALSNQVAASSLGRYSASDASADRTSLMQTINTTRDVWSSNFKTLMDQNTDQYRQILDLANRTTRLESKSEQSHPTK